MRAAARKVARELSRALDAPNSTDWVSVAKRCILMLALPPRKIRKRDPARAARRTSVKDLDALCREVVFGRDGGCRFCALSAPGVTQPGTQLQWAHIFSRRYRWIRHDITNSVCLCAGHHLWAHHSPPLADRFFRAAIEQSHGPKAYDALKLRAGKAQKSQPELTRILLEQEAKRLGLTCP